MRDPTPPPLGRPLTEPQRRLIALLADAAVAEFLAEPDASPEQDALNDTKGTPMTAMPFGKYRGCHSTV